MTEHATIGKRAVHSPARRARGWSSGVGIDKAARYECQACGGLVSARTGTAYAGVRTEVTTYLRKVEAGDPGHGRWVDRSCLDDG